MNAPEIRHPIARRLVTELDAVVLGWVDRATGAPYTVTRERVRGRPHPEIVRVSTRRLRELAQEIGNR